MCRRRASRMPLKSANAMGNDVTGVIPDLGLGSEGLEAGSDKPTFDGQAAFVDGFGEIGGQRQGDGVALRLARFNMQPGSAGGDVHQRAGHAAMQVASTVEMLGTDGETTYNAAFFRMNHFDAEMMEEADVPVA